MSAQHHKPLMEKGHCKLKITCDSDDDSMPFITKCINDLSRRCRLSLTYIITLC